MNHIRMGGLALGLLWALAGFDGAWAGGPQAGQAAAFGVSAPLRILAPPGGAAEKAMARAATEPMATVLRGDARGQFLPLAGTAPESRDPVVQARHPKSAMPAPILTFEGIGNVSGVLPPDPVGDIGPSNYVEAVNLRFQVFDRAGTPLTAPAKISTLFAAIGGAAATYDDGDPIVCYDQLADRWLISQFLVSVTPYHEVIAISQTPDPTGPYYCYDFIMPGNNMNDYPHFGVWPDAYYMTDNQYANGSAWAGAGVFAFDRRKMLAGDRTASYIYFNLYERDPSIGGMLPCDLDGPPPPLGTPNYFAYFTADEWGDPQDGLKLYTFSADFANPAQSVFTQVADLATAPFDPNFAGGRANIPQPGTTAKLDVISDRLMYRLQYRHFVEDGYETLAVNHTVDENGSDHAGVRYYQLRRALPGGTFYIHDQGTYAPDAAHRWMGSAALDYEGNYAVGYSVASTTVYPSIRYAGRLATDPPGTLTQDEATLWAGTGSQTHTASRWGDYTMLAVDPVDDVTFWFVNEYLQTTSSADWKTRIGSFKFTGSAPAPRAWLYGTVTDAGSGAPISNAVILADAGYHRATDGSGAYRAQVYPGTYALGATAAGYLAATATASAANGQNVAVNFSLAPILPGIAPTSTLLAIGAPGGPFAPTSTVYVLTNSGVATLTWTATWAAAWLDVAPAGGALDPGGSAAVLVALTAAATNMPEHPAPHAADIVFSNAVSGITQARAAGLWIYREQGVTNRYPMDVNPGWTAEGGWAWGVPQGIGGDPTNGFTGTNVYGYNLAGQYTNNMSVQSLTSKPLDCSRFRGVTLQFRRWLGVERNTYDHARLQVSSDGVTWSNVWENGSADLSESAWTLCTYSLAAVADLQPAVYLRWTMGPSDSSTTFSGWNIDDVEIVAQAMIEQLAVTPVDEVTISGCQYGPFAPGSQVYHLTNSWTETFVWTVAAWPAWLNLSTYAGVLGVGDGAAVTAAVNTAAAGLAPGTYASALVFSNTASGVAVSRPVALIVTPVPRYSYAMDLDPGWPRAGQWAFGRPQGAGGSQGGYPDPAAGYTGTNVLGVNLAGDYTVATGSAYYLEAGPFDFSGASNVTLQYERWLNTDVKPFVDATVEVSSNGATWAAVWENHTNPDAPHAGPAPRKPMPRNAAVTARAWTRQSHDLHVMADGCPALRVRWGYQVLDAYALAMSGWNLDDVVFYADTTNSYLAIEPQTGAAASGDEGGPFAPATNFYVVKNMGAGGLAWTAACDAAWLDVEPAGGVLAGHAYTTLTLRVNPSADLLPPAEYTALVTWSNAAGGGAVTRPVRLAVLEIPGRVAVTPAEIEYDQVFVGLAAATGVTVSNQDVAHALVVTNLSLTEMLRETFDDGAAQDWDPQTPAYWLVTGQEYRAQAGALGVRMQSAYAGQSWKNCQAQVTIRRSGNSASIARLFVRGTTNLSYNGNTGDAYMVGISGRRDYYVGKMVNGAFTFIQNWDVSSYLNSDPIANVVGLGVQGQVITAYFNGHPAWRGTDSSLTNAGTAGLFAYSSGASPETVYYFNDFEVVPSEPGAQHFELDGVPGLPLALPPGGAANFTARFIPARVTEYHAFIDIQSNDRTNPLVRIQASGLGVDDWLAVMPAAISFAGHPGGPFTPEAVDFGLSNTQAGLDIPWTAQEAAAWLGVAPGSGVLASNAAAAVTASLTAAAATLPAGVYSNAVRFSNQVTGVIADRWALLDVYRSPEMEITPNSLTITQKLGAAAVTALLVVTNAGDTNLFLTATGTVAWLDVAPGSLLVPAGSASNLAVTMLPADLFVDQYSGQIQLLCNDRSNPTSVVPVQLTVLPNDLYVTPNSALAASGAAGGPFVPSNKTYTIQNTGGSALNWTVHWAAVEWLDVAPAGGSLATGTTVAARVALTTNAYRLAAGTYSNRVVFSNLLGGYATARDIRLTVQSPPVTAGTVRVLVSTVPYTNLAMAFGTVTGGQARVEYISVTNTDLSRPVLVSAVRLTAQYVENFSSGTAAGWQPDDPAWWSVVSNAYVAQGDGTNFMTALYLGQSWADLSTEISYARSGGVAAGGGLALRASDDFDAYGGRGSAYVFQIAGTSNYMVWKQVDGEFGLLQSWTASPAVRPAGNYLVAGANGSALRFYINGELVWQGTDTALTNGRIGLVGYTAADDPTRHAFALVAVGGPYDYGALKADQAAGQDADHYALLDAPVTPTNLAAQRGFSFGVRFAPLAVGPLAASVLISSDDPQTPNAVVRLAGTGAGAPVSILALAGPHGAVSPTGWIQVAYGGGTTFVITADAYYHINEVRTNAAPVAGLAGGARTNFAWQGITTSGTLDAGFAENLATNRVPQWWLAAHGLTNQPWDEAALADPDGDGPRTWQEFWADTDPTNPASYFHVLGLRVPPGGPAWVTVVGSTQRLYGLYGASNLAGGAWDPLWTNAAGTNAIMTLGATNLPVRQFYRPDVSLPW